MVSSYFFFSYIISYRNHSHWKTIINDGFPNIVDKIKITLKGIENNCINRKGNKNGNRGKKTNSNQIHLHQEQNQKAKNVIRH